MAMALWLTAFGALALTSGIALAAGQPEGQPAHDMTRAEAQAHADAMFDRIDVNHDGTISVDEWTSFRSARAEHQGGGHMGMHGGEHAGAQAMTKQDFEARALARFDRMDTNHDGIVSAAEREQARAAMRERFGG